MPRFCRLFGSPDVFYLADREVAIADVVAAPFPPLPREPGIKLHWLAVNGRQPACADNPPLPTHGRLPSAAAAADGGAHPAAKRPKVGAGAGADAPVDGAHAQRAGAGAAGAAAIVVGPAEHVLSQEEALLFSRIVATVRAAAEPPRTPAGGGARGAASGADNLSWGQLSAAAAAGGALGTNGRVDGEAEAAAAAAAAADETKRGLLSAVLRSVASEPSTGPLAPFLAQFICAEVSSSLAKTHALLVLVRLADALIRSPQPAVEHYVHQVGAASRAEGEWRAAGCGVRLGDCLPLALTSSPPPSFPFLPLALPPIRLRPWHFPSRSPARPFQLMPALLTCTVHRRLCASPLDDHWAVRDAAARVVARVCARYGSAYPALQPRVTQTLLGALRDRGRPLTTHYGAIVGLAALGAHIVHGLLLPELLGGGAAGGSARARAHGAPPAAAKPGGKAEQAGGERGAPGRDAGGLASASAASYLATLEPELRAQHAVRQQEAMRVYAAALSASATYIHRHRHLFELAAGAQQPHNALISVARRAAARAEPAARAAEGDVEMADAAAAPAGAASPGADAPAGARSITERALQELLPQLGVNYALLYSQFGEALLPSLACEPPPPAAAAPARRAGVPPLLAAGNRAATSAGGAAAASTQARPAPKVAARSRPCGPARSKMALSLLAIC